MFRRTSENLPADPSFPAELHALGYKVNQLGQFVEAESEEGEPADFFDFYHTDNERANDVRKEAMHECARREVVERLSELGVDVLYAHGETFAEVRPEGPHVAILATELEALREKREVLVVVNEHMQDLGIWAYRLLMGEAGIEGGSAVGLVKKLQGWQSTTVEVAIKNLKLDGINQKSTEDGANSPGVIILNPGELLYSHKLNRSMSQATWLARPMTSAIGEATRIDEVHNRVPGHETSEAHVRTMLEHIVPAITSEEVRLFFVGLSDGSEHLLKYLDDKLFADNQAPIGSNLEAVALIQPTHVPEQLKSVSLGTFLAAAGTRSYISSDRPKGELLVMPHSPITHHTDGTSSLMLEAEGTHDREGSRSDTSTSTPIPIPGTCDQADPFEQVATNSQDSHRSLQSKISDSYSFPKSASALQRSMHSLPSDTGIYDLSRAMAIRPRANTTDSKLAASTNDLAQSNDDLALSKEGGYGFPDPDLEPYPYYNDPVSCPTFSAGVEEVSEVIWPTVMDSVLEWFKALSEYADEREQRMLGSQQMKDGGGSGFL
ncbi:hypothetical protein B0A55_05684 [Friedmanniomyces simplex]|uniref:Arb2 domain-containing protein n=1 Tax=Friedmanniomyces simplex TaxID=329884 RepID=A0A4U0XEE6_9PEZI|nr:hypothetical protein B0A55_05684 [Friedmanniomyces simplex]